jgi:hypothetical protein
MKTRPALFFAVLILAVYCPGIAHSGDDKVSDNSEHRATSHGDAELAVVQVDSSSQVEKRQEALVSALNSLTLQITNDASLEPTKIAEHKLTIDANKDFFGASRAIIAASFKLVETYDTEIGPLWVSDSPIKHNSGDTILIWPASSILRVLHSHILENQKS